MLSCTNSRTGEGNVERNSDADKLNNSLCQLFNLCLLICFVYK